MGGRAARYLMGRELLTWVPNTRTGSRLTFPSAICISLYSEVPFVRQQSLNLISGGKKMGERRLIPSWTAFDVRISENTRCWARGVNNGAHLVSGEVREMVGSEWS